MLTLTRFVYEGPEMATALMRIVASRRSELELPYLMTMAPRKLSPKLHCDGGWRSWLLQVPNHANAICDSQKYLAYPALSLIHILSHHHPVYLMMLLEYAQDFIDGSAQSHGESPAQEI